ncbi:hypothetical protein BGZ61DRAFT_135831 [Ilyonectria robusta]|uniref:uncharacterized protein n=1 Tax=Ilyonectria robusta TaxID=1079257 RepID=UPI001E8DDD98|nr:uncharacterized protein BGZ61DRAFT_135831 [Ilyonectria robusta]KAH8735143.1 hypothetical protein BGZ61DRAFT_135831 [Ilyonectria robusta]
MYLASSTLPQSPISLVVFPPLVLDRLGPSLKNRDSPLVSRLLPFLSFIIVPSFILFILRRDPLFVCLSFSRAATLIALIHLSRL